MKYRLLFFAFLIAACRHHKGADTSTTTADKSRDTAGVVHQKPPCGAVHLQRLETVELAAIADSISQEHFSFSKKKGDIPEAAKCWLDAISGTSHFTLADSAESWQCCCDRSDTTLADYQLIGHATSPHYFLLAYRSGGIGVMTHLLVIRHDGDAARDYWEQEIRRADMNSVAGMLRALKQKAH